MGSHLGRGARAELPQAGVCVQSGGSLSPIARGPTHLGENTSMSNRTVVLRRLVLAGLCVACCGVPSEAGEGLPIVVLNARTYTAGAKSGSVAFLDPESYEKLGSTDVGRNPILAQVDPDRKFLYVLNRGKTRGRKKKKVLEEGTLSVIELASRKLVSTLQVGFDPLGMVISEHHPYLYVFSRGKKGQKSLLTVVDRNTQTKLTTLPTAVGGIAFPDLSGARWLYLAHEGNPTGKESTSPILLIFDTQKRKVVVEETLAFPAVKVRASSDKTFVYIVCAGKGKKKKNSPAGALLMIRGREVIGRVELEDAPKDVKVGPDGTLYLLGDKAIAIVDPEELKQVQRFPLKHEPRSILFSSEKPHVYVDSRKGLTISVLDLESGEVRSTLKTGSKGRKAFKVFGYGLQAVKPGFLLFPEWARAGIALRPDGHFLYALNVKSDDVTVVDTRTISVVDVIPSGFWSQGLLIPPGGRYLYAVAATELRVIDMETNELAIVHSFFRTQTEDPTLTYFDGDRDNALLAGGNSIAVFSLSNNRRTVTIGGLPGPLQVILPSPISDEEIEKQASEEQEVEDMGEVYRAEDLERFVPTENN